MSGSELFKVIVIKHNVSLMNRRNVIILSSSIILVVKNSPSCVVGLARAHREIMSSKNSYSHLSIHFHIHPLIHKPSKIGFLQPTVGLLFIWVSV